MNLISKSESYLNLVLGHWPIARVTELNHILYIPKISYLLSVVSVDLCRVY